MCTDTKYNLIGNVHILFDGSLLSISASVFNKHEV